MCSSPPPPYRCPAPRPCGTVWTHSTAAVRRRCCCSRCCCWFWAERSARRPGPSPSSWRRSAAGPRWTLGRRYRILYCSTSTTTVLQLYWGEIMQWKSSGPGIELCSAPGGPCGTPMGPWVDYHDDIMWPLEVHPHHPKQIPVYWTLLYFPCRSSFIRISCCRVQSFFSWSSSQTGSCCPSQDAPNRAGVIDHI